MFHSTRLKFIFTFLCVSFLAGGISLFIGARLLYDAVLREATNQTRLALNAAEDVYHTNVRFVDLALNITTLGMGFRNSFIERDVPDLVDRLERMAKNADLDFTGIALSDGRILCRIGGESLADSVNPPDNPIVRLVLDKGASLSGTLVVSRSFLENEAPDRAGQIQLYPFNMAGPDAAGVESQEACMAIAAAIPIFEYRTTGKLLGVLYGGRLLNQSTEIVDSAQKSVFFDEIQPETTMPTATIFFDTVRIATNMIDPQGNRAIGTRVSDEVKQQVIIRGKEWTERGEDLSDQYISAFMPIADIFGKRVGMLSVAIPESNYSGVQQELIVIFIAVTFLGALISIGMGFFAARRIMAPVLRLIKASREVSEGNVAPDIGPISKDKEMAILQKTFRDMVESMQRRRMASQSKIIQSEKQASVGRLAAGVAHEINNPLTGVLTYTHMLLRRTDIDDDIRSDLKVIVQSTERVRKIVKGLLDFSRQTKLDPEPTDINRLMDATIKLVENQALLKGVGVHFEPGDSLPMIVLDRSQIESVFLNMILNALDATNPSDEIRITSSSALSANDIGHQGVEVTIADNGCGMPPEHLNQIFEPFFSTKDVGKGTGLGLSVSLGIVKEHGGNIRVQSELGKGTTFFIWLPIDREGDAHERAGSR
ncbi:MAG: HAMP domain-containing protein [Desulfobacteraceae bacterium]|nr:MAG: HAMP domain-containing protein [Desulfobacteraceae bacterium]